MANEDINPEVDKSLSDMSGERIAERSSQEYTRHFWSAIKNGHYRMALKGAAIGAPISAAIGVGVCAVLGWSLAPILIPAIIGVGTLMAVEGFGTVGAAAASRASGLAEKHARILDAEDQKKGRLKAYDDHLMHDGSGHHIEFPTNRDKGKFFVGKSGLTGAGIGVVIGALLGATHLAAEIPVVASLTTALAAVPAIAAAAPLLAAGIAGAVAFGLLGLTFGIQRHVMKSIFNHTDATIAGKLKFTPGPDLGKAQSQESDRELAEHRLRRQEEIWRLEKSYNKRISWGAVVGRFKGFGGVVPGVVFGALAGALVLGVLALTGGAAALPMALHAALIPGFAAAGGLYAMKVYSESGTEAGAEATAQAIDNEFERNRALRAKGITPPAPKEPKVPYFSGKSALMSAVVGAGVGVALSAAMGPGILALLPAAMAAHVTTGALLGATAVAGAGVGAAYGITDKAMADYTKPLDKLYDGVLYSHPKRGHTQAPMQQPLQNQTTVTQEEAALLNEKLERGNSKSFTQITQQAQLAPATLTVGG